MANRNLARSNEGDLEQVAVEVTLGEDGKSQIQRNSRAPDLPRSENDDEDASDQWMQRNRAVQKRLGRMQRKFDQTIADREAAHQREISDLRKEFRGLSASRGESTSTTEAEHEAAQAKLQEQVVAAQDEGNSAEVARIQRLIAKNEGEFWHKKTMAQLHSGGEGEGREDARETARRDATGGTGTPRPAPSAGKEWITANEDWWEDEDFMVERAAANAIHNALRAEGSDDSDPKHYERVAKRLVKKFPDMDKKIQKVGARFDEDDDEEDEQPGRKGERGDLGGEGRRGPSTNFGDRGGGNGRIRGRMTLTPSQVENMRAVHLDPDNDAHVLAYAREANLLAASGEG